MTELEKGFFSKPNKQHIALAEWKYILLFIYLLHSTQECKTFHSKI